MPNIIKFGGSLNISEVGFLSNDSSDDYITNGTHTTVRIVNNLHGERLYTFSTAPLKLDEWKYIEIDCYQLANSHNLLRKYYMYKVSELPDSINSGGQYYFQITKNSNTSITTYTNYDSFRIHVRLLR